MRNILFVLSFVLATLHVQALQILRAEFLGRPTNHSITLNMRFDSVVEIRTQLGTQSGVYTRNTSWHTFQAGEPAEWVIDSLQPGQKYFYRIQYHTPGNTTYTLGQEHTFRTARQPNNTFTFLVQADPHMDEQTDTAIYIRCMQNQLLDSADFMIDLGDFLMTDKLKRTGTNTIPYDTIPYRCHVLRKKYEIASHSLPIFNVLGNHEGESGWNLNGTPNNIAVWNTNLRKSFFPAPFPDSFFSGDTAHYNFVGQRGSYYSFTWGDALFVMIDPYWFTNPKPDSLHGWRWTLGEQQYFWLKNTLEQSPATYKFVFSHQLVGGDPDGRGGIEFSDFYEWGGKNLDGTDGWATNRPGWPMPVKDLLTANHVNIFFHGHDHFFGKQQRDCLIYQESPQPSHPNFQNTNFATAYGYVNGQILPNSGHIRVTVSPTQTMVQYVRVYKPANENATRHNRDVSATYFIGNINCYDSVSVGYPILWNKDFADELIYPNPSSNESLITFKLNETKSCFMGIYDASCKLIRTLINNSEVPAGSYLLHWDGLTSAGNEAPEGIYLCTLNGRNLGKIIRKKS